MHRPCGELREALAVDVLGAIEPADRGVLDRHLAGCADCQGELAGLAGLPALLRRVSVEEATALADGDAGIGRSENLPSGPVLHSMLVSSSRQRGRRGRTMAAVPLSGIRGFVPSSGSRILVRVPVWAGTAVSPTSPAGTSW
jgi:Putative zinc-finger